MHDTERKLLLLSDICRSYTELSRLRARWQAEDQALARRLADGDISVFRYQLDSEQSRRQLRRLKAVAITLGRQYETIKAMPG